MSKNVRFESDKYSECAFLGGTCGKSVWRKELEKMFSEEVLYFDPQVENWTAEDAEREDACKPIAKLLVFVITGDALGTYSGWEIREAAETPERLIFAVVGDIPENQAKGLEKIKKQLRKMGATVADDLEEVASLVNQAF